jgi:hypothetical protein
LATNVPFYLVMLDVANWAAAYSRNKDIERSAQIRLLHCVFSNPFHPIKFDPAWLTSSVHTLAQTIYDHHLFDRFPILADALEEAGCSNNHILDHCRLQYEHGRGCWVLDSILGKY